MANTFTAVIPQLLAQGLMALREQAMMARVVNRQYETTAGQKGSTIDVPIPSAIVVQAVAPGATPPATADVTPTSVPIALDQWFEAPFYLTDKEQLEVQNGTIPMQASEAIRALINKVDTTVLAEYKGIYGYVGTAGMVPFGTPGVADATNTRKVLEKQLAPRGNRAMILDPDAEAAALGLNEFASSDFTGGFSVINQAELGEKLGFRWGMDQNVPTHVAGTVSGLLVNNGAGYAVGIATITTDTGSGTLVEGDIITFANHAQTYAVLSTVGGGTITSVTFQPGLKAALIDNEAITKKATHVVNLGIHRDCIALASRPLESATEGLGSISLSRPDPISGLSLRVEVTREFKRTRYSYDMLWGVKLIRPELGCRLAG